MNNYYDHYINNGDDNLNKGSNECPILDSKNMTGKKVIDLGIQEIKSRAYKKMNLIWLEATGCSGNIIT